METALVYASAKGEIDKVTILLALGARVDARDEGFTPLLVAAQFGHKEVCELLLANGSDLEERITGTLMTALHFAAVLGHQSLLELLLSHKADVNSRDRRGFTPLHLASQEGHLASVVALLQSGADPLLPYLGSSPPTLLLPYLLFLSAPLFILESVSPLPSRCTLPSCPLFPPDLSFLLLSFSLLLYFPSCSLFLPALLFFLLYYFLISSPSLP